MKYNWEFKIECVEKYRTNIPITVPECSKASHHDFMHMVRDWNKIYEKYGIDGLRKNNSNRLLSPEEKFDCITRIMSGESYRDVAIDKQISASTLHVWNENYQRYGYDGLQLKKGRKPKEPVMADTKEMKELTKSEKEELILLRKRIEYLEAENAYLKKLRALAARKKAESSVRAKRQKSSKDSEKKDID